MTEYVTSSISPTDRILRWPEVQTKVGYSRSNILYLTQQGEFPGAIKLGSRAVGWLESEVNAWIRDRVELSRMGEN